MTETKIESRVAVLEHLASEADDDIKGSLAAIAKHMQEEDVKWETIRKELSDLKATVTKYKSFLGGVVFTVSAVWGVFLVVAKFMGWFANGS